MLQKISAVLIWPVLAWAAVVNTDLPHLVEKRYTDLPALAASLNLSSQAFDDFKKQIEAQKKEAMDRLEAERKQLHEQDGQARKELDAVNRSASIDTPEMARSRRELHCRILDLERQIHEKQAQRAVGVPALYENRLAKMGFVQSWPRRKQEVEAGIAGGDARTRLHGDIDDIGLRRVGEGQEKDIKLGEDAIRELKARRLLPPELDDREITLYVQRLTDRIVSHSDMKVPVTATVLHSREINAFGLPGGQLFVNAGLIERTASESELAGVLGHEIAHIAARHAQRLAKPTSSVSKILFEGGELAANMFTWGAVGTARHYAREYGILGVGTSIRLPLLGVRTDLEAEADQLGMQYLWRAGLDPRGFLNFYDSIASEQDQTRSASFFRTHPPHVERVLTWFSELACLPKRPPTRDASLAFRRARERIRVIFKQDEMKQNEEQYGGIAAECAAPRK